MNDELLRLAGEYTAGEDYDKLSEQLELESVRYSRALREEEEARLQ